MLKKIIGFIEDRPLLHLCWLFKPVIICFLFLFVLGIIDLTSPIQPYRDFGEGIMLIEGHHLHSALEEMQRWRLDYPERAKNIQGIAYDFHQNGRLIIIYEVP